ncbi:hypothetical protein GCM10011392_01090 [Wenxinia marina]|uniref:Site-specific recombinase, DNA invertase Pin-like protein n=2 Tax=Wenxinia TaxID=653686 RepID=A0A0D0Q724_9RHOB|nr:recombinase family protein [Wenxinia marina]KIQ70189.1 Site-specific recombinase, DNA invertase Pin-like protein [Wenxinia marina DSM 24838]GGL50736.1 hypothetical protein GCM10011392_01090 [Wenxinia marina]
MTRPTVRCAVYTRKSSDEGLEQDFNSLDAQAEACAAYIASQRHEGWRPLPGRYDDGGISGGTLDRPGLQRLLAEVDAGRVDMIVVYKIDRLTRSLADFARLVERLEAKGCSFVSVTQAFNTSSSMGRLTLNVLLSFAQFEREVTGERIRDKIAASKKKGLWMGALPPLGYDPHLDRTRRELVVNEAEAETVRRIFALYDAHGSLAAVEAEADRESLRSKSRLFASGRRQGGGRLSRGHLHRILTNPIYRGLIVHKDKTWPGTHPAIIDQATWDRVQARLQETSGRRRGGATKNAADGTAPLVGRLFDPTGDRLTPTQTTRGGVRHRYYVSNRLIANGADPTGWRLPAKRLETILARIVAERIEELAAGHRLVQKPDVALEPALQERARDLAEDTRQRGGESVAPIVRQATLSGRGTVRIDLDAAVLAHRLFANEADLAPDLLSFDAPFEVRRRGVEARILAGDRQPAPDRVLLTALRHAHRWAAAVRQGATVREVATSVGRAEGYVARLLPLALLSPRIQEAIVQGTQPVDLTLERLSRTPLPLEWERQEAMIGLRG